MSSIKFDSQINKQNPFRVPDNYFDNFSANIMSQIRQEHNSIHDIPFIKWIPLIGAACISLLFVVFTQQTDSLSGKINSAGTVAEHAKDTFEDDVYEYMFSINDNFLTYDNYE